MKKQSLLISTIVSLMLFMMPQANGGWGDFEYEYDEFLVFTKKLYCFKAAHKDLDLPSMCEEYEWVPRAEKDCPSPFLVSYKYTNDNILPTHPHCPVGGSTTCQANPDLCSSVPVFGSD